MNVTDEKTTIMISIIVDKHSLITKHTKDSTFVICIVSVVKEDIYISVEVYSEAGTLHASQLCVS